MMGEAKPMYPALSEIPLPYGLSVWSGSLPNTHLPDAATFDQIWRLHPEEYHQIRIHGRDVATPRWQQAYGRDYHYTGKTNGALPVAPILAPFLAWGQSLDVRVNGLLLNWYDAEKGHYIGAHRDSTTNMIADCPIITLSLGATRNFRFRPWKGLKNLPDGPVFTDLAVPHGSVVLIPYATNLRYTHEVPHSKGFGGRRISITLRGFLEEPAQR